jgi:hypothetical protein
MLVSGGVVVVGATVAGSVVETTVVGAAAAGSVVRGGLVAGAVGGVVALPVTAEV